MAKALDSFLSAYLGFALFFGIGQDEQTYRIFGCQGCADQTARAKLQIIGMRSNKQQIGLWRHAVLVNMQ